MMDGMMDGRGVPGEAAGRGQACSASDMMEPPQHQQLRGSVTIRNGTSKVRRLIVVVTNQQEPEQPLMSALLRIALLALDSSVLAG